MKKTIYLILCVMIISSFSFASTTAYERSLDDLKVDPSIEVTEFNKKMILTTPKVNETEKVYDFADLFTTNQEELLYNEIISFVEDNNMDMAVVTTNSNNKSTAEKYADDFYDYNAFGKGTTHDGLLFLIDMDTREIYISTAGEAIIIYDDYRINSILDSAYDKIADKKYFDCAMAFVNGALSYAKQGIPNSNINTTIDSNGNYHVNETSSNEPFEFPLGTIVLISFIISGVIVWISASSHKMIKAATNARSYLDRESINITGRRDAFLSTHTTSVKIVTESSGGGSFHGGSSTHFSSSGRSHGGGGRHF